MGTSRTSIGPFQIVREIGRGGMGVVHLGRDTRLDRDVAIKALPDDVASDHERLARFEREAKSLAQLIHPNVAGIYGLEEHEGRRYLILEYVEGETLADRLRRGPLHLHEALEVGAQIAAGVEAAHEAGVIHRDLKPSNVKITPEGVVKVLDFGLARTLAGDDPTTAGSSESVTITNPARSPTEPGAVLGTAPYMSPEQARGRPADRRTDIFSFGCILYECLTGAAPFEGGTATESIAATIHQEPDWAPLDERVPPPLASLLRRCLAKDKRRRLQAIGDARIELEELASGGWTPTGGPIERPPGARRLGAGAALFLLGALVGAAALVGWAMESRAPGQAPTGVHLSIVEPMQTPLPRYVDLYGSTVAISRDGSHVAYIGSVNGRSHLFVRDLSAPESRRVPGTEGAATPFFSPDGKRIAFVSRGKLWTVSRTGSTPTEVCELQHPRGGCWIDEDTIIAAQITPATLSRIRISTGSITRLTTLDASRGDLSHRHPEPLPNGDALLTVLRRTGAGVIPSVAVCDLPSGDTKVILEEGGHAHYAEGAIFFTAANGVVRAVPYDVEQKETIGAPVTVLEGVRAMPLTFSSHFAISETGALAYSPGGAMWAPKQPVWRTRDGASEPALPESRTFTSGRVSPDGRYLAVAIAEPMPDAWRYDLHVDPPTRLRLTDDGLSIQPIWSPDGRRIVATSFRGGAAQIYEMSADGAGEERRLPTPASTHSFATAWSSDGSRIAFTDMSPDRGNDVWILSLDEEREPWPVASTRFNEEQGAFSPDGRWIAYASDETGHYEIYIRRVDGSGGAHPVSVGGGVDPLWRGEEIFFRQGDDLMAASVQVEAGVEIGAPERLFGGLASSGPPIRTFDLHPDGERFLVTMPATGEDRFGFLEIRVATDWVARVKREF